MFSLIDKQTNRQGKFQDTETYCVMSFNKRKLTLVSEKSVSEIPQVLPFIIWKAPPGIPDYTIWLIDLLISSLDVINS